MPVRSWLQAQPKVPTLSCDNQEPGLRQLLETIYVILLPTPSVLGVLQLTDPEFGTFSRS